MPLIDLKTNLKSLKFGNDRPKGGSSNQPYIQTPIPPDDKDGIPSTEDFLLRGGLSAPLNALTDVSRLAQMFIDTRDPSGLLFTAKQNLLSRTAVKTEASTTAGSIYTPASTLGQAATGFAGGHLNQLGLDPTGLSNFGIPKYGDYMKSLNQIDNAENFNRLVSLADPNTSNAKMGNKITLYPEGNSPLNPTFMEYGGGPGSILGVGKTRIDFADQRTGYNSPQWGKNKFHFGGFQFKEPINYNNYLGVSDVEGLTTLETGISDDGLPSTKFGRVGLGQDNSTLSKNKKNLTLSTYDGYQVGTLNSKTTPEQITYNPPTTLRIGDRVSAGDPGKKHIRGYTGKSKYDISIVDERLSHKVHATDRIAASSIRTSISQNYGDDRNDLVKFSIGVLQNNKSKKVDYMHFRSFIDSFDDSYSAGWGSTQYAGRGDKFHNYQGFDRKISMAFTVYAQSKAELIPMYKKLNFLASSLAPSYSTGGFMQGNLVYLTMGGYLFQQLGFITGLSYSIPQESPWEIGISGKTDDNRVWYENMKSDNSVKELPHMIKVTGLSFTPIHNFLPRKADPKNQKDTRFISLNNSTKNSESNYGDIKKPNSSEKTEQQIAADRFESGEVAEDQEIIARRIQEEREQFPPLSNIV